MRFPVVLLVARYVAHRRRRGVMSAKTAADVERDLRNFAAMCPPDVRKITRRHVEQWIDQPQFAPSTRRKLLSEVRGFFRWAVIEGHVRRDPTIEIEAIEQPPTVPGSLPRDKAERIYVAHRYLEPRIRLILSLELNEALRRIEVARAQVSDIDRRGRVMRVRGKGGHGKVTGTVPLSDETSAALDTYLRTEPVILGIDRLAAGPLLRNRQRPNAGLSADRIGRLVRDALYELGVKDAPRDGVSGHALRHTAATEALEAGVPIEKVQRFLRHKHSKTTDHYTRGAVFDLREIHDRRRELRDDVIDLRESTGAGGPSGSLC